LRLLLPKVFAATGQKFIVLALLLLTSFSRVLPAGIIKFLNDKVVAILYESMPRQPTDLTGRVIDVPPHEMGLPNQPYARSVPVETALATDLPNLEDVFDKLLKRSETEDWDSVSFLFFFPSTYIEFLELSSSKSTAVDSVR
jgi:hypothetical protein